MSVFVPAGHSDRNDTQALELLVEPLPLSTDRIHPMPTSDAGLNLDRAAEEYARELGSTASTSASGMVQTARGVDLSRAPVVVRDRRGDRRPIFTEAASRAHQPTLPVINRVQEVCFGEWIHKARRPKWLCSGAGPVQVPAAGVSAVDRTLVAAGPRRGSRAASRPATTRPYLVDDFAPIAAVA